MPKTHENSLISDLLRADFKPSKSARTFGIQEIATCHGQKLQHHKRQERRGVGWSAARMRSAPIGSRVATIGSDSTERRPLGRRRSVRQGRTAANGARSGLVQGSNRPLASCRRSFRRAGIQANLERQDRTKSRDRSGCCLDSNKAICQADRSGSPGAARPSSYLCSALPRCWRRTRTDSIPPRSRLSPNDGTVHWLQTEVQRCRRRSVPNIVGKSGTIIRFIT
jgi:hypothetical protein